ncbi:MAG: PaaI family thioesterase [Rhodospirillales bacterium]|nr:PaaI family thioesterase [Rhodospirillales bacterium]
MPKVTIEEFNKIMHVGLPAAKDAGTICTEIGDGVATLRLPYDPTHLRPGGTISGPAMMALSDATMYAVVLSQIGPVELAVTTNFNINFLRKPPQADILAEGRMIKLGKRLAVMEVTLFTADDEHDPIAHATGTYSIPPRN